MHAYLCMQIQMLISYIILLDNISKSMWFRMINIMHFSLYHNEYILVHLLVSVASPAFQCRSITKHS